MKDFKKNIINLVRETEKERINVTSKVKNTSNTKKRRKEIARILTNLNKK